MAENDESLREAENKAIQLLGKDQAVERLARKVAMLEQEVAKLKQQISKKEK